MNTLDIINRAIEWSNKRLELHGEPITTNQKNYLVFALRQSLEIADVEMCELCSETHELVNMKLEQEDGNWICNNCINEINTK